METRIAQAIRWLVENHQQQPSLAQAAAVARLSPEHFSRAFHRRVGVSPKVFLKHLTLEDLKDRLMSGQDLVSATLDAGLSGHSRVHDHFVTLEATTPGEYRRGGSDLTIRYGWHEGPLGGLFAAATPRGVCFAAFTLDARDGLACLEQIRTQWPAAELVADPSATGALASALAGPPDRPLTLCVTGTNFQVQVWRALLRIPEGALTSYAALAETVGRPRSVRAVANAVGANPIGWLIPCHRVIRSSGALGGYRWGLDAKRALLARETAVHALS